MRKEVGNSIKTLVQKYQDGLTNREEEKTILNALLKRAKTLVRDSYFIKTPYHELMNGPKVKILKGKTRGKKK